MTITRIVAGLALLVVLLGCAWCISAAQETAGELYERALYLEEAKGELKQALEIYEQILRTYPEDRDVRARSQLHIGLCYEKLGLAQATRAYQKVISDYPDQAGVVSTARMRLAALREYEAEPVHPAMTVRKVWEGRHFDDTGEISPDGKLISCVDWDSGNLALYEIATGKKRFLTRGGTWDSAYAYALGSRWSPDGTQLAYAWHCGDTLTLNITDHEGASHRRLCATGGEVAWYHLSDWTGDGKHLLARRQFADTTCDAVLVSVDNGAIQVIGALGRAVDIRMRISPDGRYIAYDTPSREGFHSYDVSVMERSSGSSSPLIADASHDRVLGWVVGGKQLLFSSDRAGTPAIWSLPLVNGRPSGAPALVKETSGPFMPSGLGSSRDGSFYFAEIPNRTNVFVMEIDPTTGQVLSQPQEAINRFVGSNGLPDYSPDGKYLAYVSRRGPLNVQYTTRPLGDVLCVRSLDAGTEKEISLGLGRVGFPKWAPDNRTIMVVSFEYERYAHYLIDTQSGEVKFAFASARPDRIMGHEWCADGQSVYLVRDMEDSMSVVIRNLRTGDETQLLRRPGIVPTISRSPDGRWLAILNRDPERELNIMPASGGPLRVVHQYDAGDYRTIWHTWTADSKHILLPKVHPPREDLLYDLWRIPVNGGESRNLGVQTTLPWQLSAHPDGRHIAYSSSGTSPEPARIWVMENFLPAEAGQAEATVVPVD